MYVCMNIALHTYIHTYMHIKYIKLEKVMGLRGQTPKTSTEQRWEVSPKCPMTLWRYGTCGTVRGHLGDLWAVMGHLGDNGSF